MLVSNYFSFWLLENNRIIRNQHKCFVINLHMKFRLQSNTHKDNKVFFIMFTTPVQCWFVFKRILKTTMCMYVYWSKQNILQLVLRNSGINQYYQYRVFKLLSLFTYCGAKNPEKFRGSRIKAWKESSLPQSCCWYDNGIIFLKKSEPLTKSCSKSYFLVDFCNIVPVKIEIKITSESRWSSRWHCNQFSVFHLKVLNTWMLFSSNTLLILIIHMRWYLLKLKTRPVRYHLHGVVMQRDNIDDSKG